MSVDHGRWIMGLLRRRKTASIVKRSALLFVFITVMNHSTSEAESPSPSSSDRLKLAESAEAAYRQGLELIGGSTDALAAFRSSAEGWRQVIAAGGNGPAAWFNLGNAELRAGNLGEAIAAYRRAERLDPIDDDIAANLAEARRRVTRPIEADGGTPFRNQLGSTPRRSPGPVSGFFSCGGEVAPSIDETRSERRRR
jgi:tetratricopeptide (TPR) repeat protein